MEKSYDLRYHPLTDLVIPHRSTGLIDCITANVLLLFHSLFMKDIYICNLITCEYIELSYPKLYIPWYQLLQVGFGVSKISGQYKVVWINPDRGSNSHCVYTLGTGTWRRIEAGAASGFRFPGEPILCNDNLHWRVYFSKNHILGFCGFDVETECFSIFSFPRPMGESIGNLSVLRNRLCYSYYTHSNDEIVIWMMKEYQVYESWTIEYKMSTNGSDLSFRMPYMHVEAIKLFKDGDVFKLFKDGDVLMLLDHFLF